ncbi:MAG: hypothetical protein QUU85_04390, partial [Candidatus Eisenbacteria bacterium]|nr:hypothetical protein [Candidatus Eisenbacteria bacterium]
MNPIDRPSRSRPAASSAPRFSRLLFPLLLLLLLLLAPAFVWFAGGAGAQPAPGAAPPASADTLVVPSWLVIGPFPSGVREALVDPIWPATPSTLAPSEGDSMASWLAPGGWAK